jgi:hypothetical protein
MKLDRVILKVGEIAATTATVYLAWRIIAGPDANRRLLMKTAKIAEARCMRNAQKWAALADKADGLYERGRNVSV